MPEPARSPHPLAALWLYTLLRVLLFGAVFGVLWLVGVRGFLGAMIALILTLPLSYVLLAGARQRMAASVAGRFQEHRARDARLDDELRRAGTETDTEDRQKGTSR